MPNSYFTTSKGYLKRAQARLTDGTREALFYAAFELRCGIEARLQDYLDAQAQIPKRKKQGWKIVAATKELERVFRVGDKIAEYMILDHTSEQARFGLYYTPVRKRLRDAGARLGDLLHAMKESRDDADPWWDSIRTFLLQIAGDLAFANRGTLLGPIMQSPDGSYHTCLHYSAQSPILSQIQAFAKAGNHFKLRVSYHDCLPDYAHACLNPVDD